LAGYRVGLLEGRQRAWVTKDRRVSQRTEGLFLQRQTGGRRIDCLYPANLGFPRLLAAITLFRKDRNHVSSEFGDYVDDSGNVVKSNVDARKGPQPPGTHFDGAANGPIACISTVATQLHEGYVPRYAASHGCIRLPKRNGPALFRRQSRRHDRDRERVGVVQSRSTMML